MASKIQWRPWSKAAFEEAQSADKPILLRLSAVWCHWCHVMDQTSDVDPRAVALLNERYVPIRVDIDKMPDVRDRYNFGGYPTSAFLTPAGDILTGGTYIPPDRFVELLEAVDKAYRQRKAEIEQQLAEHRSHRPAAAPLDQATGLEKIARRIYDEATTAVLGLFDAEHGGFGSQPKFPQPSAVLLAIEAFRDTGGKEYETVARRTLDGMKSSELWDSEELAFFRYCVRSNWTEPHYEKMLETNAGLLSSYAAAYATFQDPTYRETLNDMRTYLERVLRDAKNGLFFGSQDADEEYYAKSRAERATRTPPFVDPVHYTDWNMMMVGGYCRAYRATGDPSWLAEAVRTSDSLMRLLERKGGGFFHFLRDGKPQTEGILSDQVHAISALLDVFELTGNERYLEAAIGAAQYAQSAMWDGKRSVFNDRAPGPEDLGLLREPHTNIVDNGVAAASFLRLEFHRPQKGFRATAEAVLRGQASAGERFGLFAAELALAALKILAPTLEVHVCGTPADAVASIAESAKIRAANVRILRSEGPWPGAATKLGKAPPPRSVFFCTEGACSRLYNFGEPFADDALRLLSAART
jgi:uncharacterized protein